MPRCNFLNSHIIIRLTPMLMTNWSGTYKYGGRQLRYRYPRYRTGEWNRYIPKLFLSIHFVRFPLREGMTRYRPMTKKS